ncbi:MAG: signal peptidase I [Faecalibacterium sp.]|jgi:signal peptidase I|nr:signal peptidase I [Faecalibacterium sp.]
MTEEGSEKSGQGLLEWYEALVFAIVVVVVAFSFALRITLVNGTSMVPTLQDQDRLVVWAAGYTPAHGDIVILDGYIDFGKPLVKRIIGLPGDTVNIDFSTGEVSVNGEVLDEPYIADQTHLQGDVTFPLTVPEGKVFVMGDNRNGSTDSRFSSVGCIDERDVLGKAFFRLLPFSEIGTIA